MIKRLLFVACVMTALAYARPAHALALCSVSSVSNIDFGAYDVFSSSPLTGQGSVTVGCLSLLSNQTFQVTLSKGSSNSYASRTMQLGASNLNYNLYLNTQNTVIFGDGTGGSSVWGPYGPTVLTLGSVNIPIYGLIPARQNVPAGIYTDTIIVTVAF